MQIGHARREVQQRFRAVNGDHPVTEADEPAIRAFLTECAQAMRATWEPLLDEPAAVPAP